MGLSEGQSKGINNSRKYNDLVQNCFKNIYFLKNSEQQINLGQCSLTNIFLYYPHVGFLEHYSTN